MKQRSFSTPEQVDPFAVLYARVKRDFLAEVEPIPVVVTTRHEQLLSLRDAKGNPVERAVVLIPGNARQLITWQKPFHRHPVLEYCARHFVVDQLEELSMPLCLNELRRYIGEIQIGSSAAEVEFTNAIDEWIRGVLEASKIAKDPRLVGLVKSFVEFSVEGEYWGWPEHLLCSLPLNSDIRRNRRTAETLLDREFGPYTQEEILTITNELDSARGVSASDKAIALVLRDWGVRPIQLVLMRTTDFGSEEGVAYLDIPGAKGKSRSRLKRSAGNFKRRPIAEDTAQAVREQISAGETLVDEAKRQLRGEFPWLTQEIDLLPTPLFPPDRLYLHMRECVTDPTLREYALHNRSQYLADQVRKLSRKLSIPQAIAAGVEVDARILRIRATRFRKTKATQMVLQGATPDEVAEALDHADVNSVRHYFRFNQDVIDFVNATHSLSPELNGMVKSWIDGWKKTSPAIGVGTSRVKGLGKCGNGSVCEKHPTISCYTCALFSPFRTADHAGAAAAIDLYANTIGANSTGPVRHQLILAAKNARQLAEEQARLDEASRENR